MDTTALHAAVEAYGEPIAEQTFQTIITKLAADGLIVRHDDTIHLPD
jgi:hypothetical protein